MDPDADPQRWKQAISLDIHEETAVGYTQNSNQFQKPIFYANNSFSYKDITLRSD